MSKFDDTQGEGCEADKQPAGAANVEQAAAVCTEQGEADFVISVRKVPVKVQARGVLAE